MNKNMFLMQNSPLIGPILVFLGGEIGLKIGFLKIIITCMFSICFLSKIDSVTERICLAKVPTIYPSIIDLYTQIMGLQQV